MNLHDFASQNDPFNLSRFLSAQDQVFNAALAELRHGQKETHWMWFIFPQLDGLGNSAMAMKYAIRSLDEARAYLAHPLLGTRLLDCCRALLSVTGKSAFEIMDSPDDLKLRSSMTLFALVAGHQSMFHQVIEKYFDGRGDACTVELLNRPSA